MFETLPTLGVGVSLSLGAEPDPVKLSKMQAGPAFIEYAGLLDVQRIDADIQRIQAHNIPLLFHPSYINFCGSFKNDLAWLKATAEHIQHVGSPWFAQDCAYCFWDENAGYSSQFGYFIPPILNQASLELAIIRVKEVQEMVGITVAIEPPPLTFIIGHMPLFEFIGKLADATDCAILLDMGHLVSFEMASFNSVLQAIAYLPVERVIEVHIAGGKIKMAEEGPVYIDAHECEVVDETWAMLESMLPLLPNLKALCYECEGVAQAQVLQTLTLLHEKVLSFSSSASLLKKVAQGEPVL
ncbi:MAG: DUF692 family protein [Pseudomonadales bacterium]|nr:DUF692 family protein [Pseudomonadales bacterium]